jgi:hypothetical protein
MVAAFAAVARSSVTEARTSFMTVLLVGRRVEADARRVERTRSVDARRRDPQPRTLEYSVTVVIKTVGIFKLFGEFKKKRTILSEPSRPTSSASHAENSTCTVPVS